MHPLDPIIPSALQRIVQQYEALLHDPERLIREGQRLAALPQIQAQPEVSLFLGVLVGHVAQLEDRIAAMHAWLDWVIEEDEHGTH
jgi:hypothetical protein